MAMSVATASNQKLPVMGGVLLTISAAGVDRASNITAKEMFYVSDGVSQVYLSKGCCEQLQTIPPDFPKVGSCPPTHAHTSPTVPTATVAPNSGCSNSGMGQQERPCSCPTHTQPPADRPALPCEPTKGNLP